MPAKRAAKANLKLTSPNQYHLSGEGVTVAYYPGGMGPVLKGGPIALVYQDAQQIRSFTSKEVRAVDGPDLGSTISVTLNKTVDLGSTSFTLLLPVVQLPDELGSSAAIQTNGITTFHRTFLAGPGQGQQETYRVIALAGDARLGLLAR